MAAQKKPNFVIIVADDLGFSDLGCFGSEINTPRLDELAAQGCRMTGFHTAAACSPTRSMLFSGTDNHIAGLGAMIEWKRRYGKGLWDDKPGYEGHLNFRVAALPEIMQDNGYRTILSGKWHLGLEPELAPHSRGFDRSFTMLSGCHNHYGYEPQYDDTPTEGSTTEARKAEAQDMATYEEFAPAMAHKKGMYNKEGEQIDVAPNIPYSPSGFFSTDSFTDQLLQYIDDAVSENKPFFSCLTYTAPHWPLQAPKRLRDKYVGKYNEGPEALRRKRLIRLEEMGLIPKNVTPHPFVNALNEKEWKELSDEQKKHSARAMEVYAAMVEHIDEAVGRVLDRLEQLGVADNTVVMFMSDNGAEGSSYEAMPHMGPSLLKIISKFYDNSLENIGEPDSFVWYGPFWAQASTAPSRLMKMFSTQGGIRVPFIIRYPPFHTASCSSPGTVIEQQTTVMDIAATVLDLASIAHPVPKGKDTGVFRAREVVPMKGKTWRKAFERGEIVHDETEALGWELHGRAGMRIGQWKVTFVPPPFGPGEWQLYNLQTDPGEVFDLKDKEQMKFRELSSAWDKYIAMNGIVWGAPLPMETINGDSIDDITNDSTGWMELK